MTSENKKIGLSLSGGGYRAAAFHLGTLKKLNEMGILDKVDVLSTISGGSITGAAWCLHKEGGGDYDSFHKKMTGQLQTVDVIRRIFRSWVFIRTLFVAVTLVFGALALSFTPYSGFVFPMLALFFFIVFKYQYQLFPVSDVIEKAYNVFFNGKTLKNLPAKPMMAIGSSNLHTGRPFTFSKSRMSDSEYANRKEPVNFLPGEFPVARAVMASSCVPFAFSPVRIDRKFYENDSNYDKVRPVLVDGGVYDNQGIHKLTQPNSSYACDIIITSDAGGPFIADNTYPNVLALLLRTVNLFMYRIKAVQMVQNIYRNMEGAGRPIAYFSLGWELKNFIPGFADNMCKGQVLPEVLAAHDFEQEWIDDPKKYREEIIKHLENSIDYKSILDRNLTKDEWELARTTGTNLTALSSKQVEYLARHAENLTEIQIKLYCPSLTAATTI